MKANLFLHGTSLAAAKKIVVEGFDAMSDGAKEVWEVSGGRNYFYSYKGLFTDFESRENCFREAFFQAEPACVRADSSRRVVFIVDLSGFTYYEDSSCDLPNAIEVNEVIPPDRIRGILIDRYDISAALPIWRASLLKRELFAASESDNPWMNLAADLFDKSCEFGGTFEFQSECEFDSLFEKISVEKLLDMRD